MSVTAVSGLAFVALCVWLMIRVVNRREVWARQALAIIATAAAFYSASFGPACWMAEGYGISEQDFVGVYRPILALASNRRVPQPFAWYASLGTSDHAELLVDDGRITWSNRCKSGLAKVPPEM